MPALILIIRVFSFSATDQPLSGELLQVHDEHRQRRRRGDAGERREAQRRQVLRPHGLHDHRTKLAGHHQWHLPNA